MKHWSTSPGRRGGTPSLRFGVLVVLALVAVPLAVTGAPYPWAPGGFPPRLDPPPPPEPASGFLLFEAEGRGSAKVLVDGWFAGTLRQGALTVAVCEGNLVELDGRLSSSPLRVVIHASAPLRLLPGRSLALEPSGRLLLAGWVRGPGWPK